MDDKQREINLINVNKSNEDNYYINSGLNTKSKKKKLIHFNGSFLSNSENPSRLIFLLFVLMIIAATGVIYLTFKKDVVNTNLGKILDDQADYHWAEMTVTKEGPSCEGLINNKYLLSYNVYDGKDQINKTISASINKKSTNIISSTYIPTENRLIMNVPLMIKGTKRCNSVLADTGINTINKIINSEYLSITRTELNKLSVDKKLPDYYGYTRITLKVLDKYKDEINIAENWVQKGEIVVSTKYKNLRNFYESLEKIGIIDDLKQEIKKEYGEKDVFYKFLSKWSKEYMNSASLNLSIKDNSFTLKYTMGEDIFSISCDLKIIDDDKVIDLKSYDENKICSYKTFMQKVKEYGITLEKYDLNDIFKYIKN